MLSIFNVVELPDLPRSSSPQRTPPQTQHCVILEEVDNAGRCLRHVMAGLRCSDSLFGNSISKHIVSLIIVNERYEKLMRNQWFSVRSSSRYTQYLQRRLHNCPSLIALRVATNACGENYSIGANIRGCHVLNN